MTSVHAQALGLGDLALDLASDDDIRSLGERHYREALALADELAKGDPGNPAAWRAQARAHDRIGRTFYIQSLVRAGSDRQSNVADAAEHCKIAVALWERLAGADAGNQDDQLGLATARSLLAGCCKTRAALPMRWRTMPPPRISPSAAARRTLATRVGGTFLPSYSGVGAVKLANGDRTSALALWRKALAIAEASAARAEQDETRSAGKPGEKTAEALTGVEWYALLARQPAKALATWERARALVPQPSAGHEINHAHALLLRNRVREATALYLAGKGKGKLSNATPWELVIADDFRDLRRAGLAHLAMREIEFALGVPPVPAERPDTSGAHRAGKR